MIAILFISLSISRSKLKQDNMMHLLITIYEMFRGSVYKVALPREGSRLLAHFLLRCERQPHSAPPLFSQMQFGEDDAGRGREGGVERETGNNVARLSRSCDLTTGAHQRHIRHVD